jgi:sulfur carrier protein
LRLTINGKPRELEVNGANEIDLPTLLARFEINPRLVAVAINGDVIPKTDYAVAMVRAGDSLEIVRMVGGGAR